MSFRTCGYRLYLGTICSSCGYQMLGAMPEDKTKYEKSLNYFLLINGTDFIWAY